ncbi:hypothetical protein CEXT_312631 [Caerostris extrusa]|uniref:Uncharacterized protein n=1 Tax=Caerostris extrusa TaxID=172846 RepID=A0AAV4UIA4_CAEEX|nr:hypothetical protein CEXT_312631 [Caerostris extrusa]
MGFIVIMEFAAGATLLIVRNTVKNYVTRLECSNECPATLDNLVLNYSLPVAGLLVGIILVEVVMMYIAMKMWMLARELSKTTETPSIDVAQNVQMRSVGSRSWLPSFGVSPIPGPSPRGNYLHNRTHTPLACYADFDGFSKPPQYETLPPDMQLPPTYMEIAPGALANRTPTSEQIYYSV